MKTKLALLGCLAVAGAGIWYFFMRDKSIQRREEELDPVGPIQENANNHLRDVMHAAKELSL